MGSFSRVTTIRLLLLLCLAAIVGVVSSSSGITDVAHKSIRLHLALDSAAVYEYHSRMGEWPSRIDDLAKTSLPLQSPYWRDMLEDEVNVIVWPKGFDPDPLKNAGRVLAYHNKGILATSGHVWVCFGDLRTEYIAEHELKALLQRGE
jgi:hypothetical protein